jgi:hypothetical protein
MQLFHEYVTAWAHVDDCATYEIHCDFRNGGIPKADLYESVSRTHVHPINSCKVRSAADGSEGAIGQFVYGK